MHKAVALSRLGALVIVMGLSGCGQDSNSTTTPMQEAPEAGSPAGMPGGDAAGVPATAGAKGGPMGGMPITSAGGRAGGGRSTTEMLGGVPSGVGGTAPVPSEARCGDGLTGGIEECDSGDENSDDSQDACRTDCRSARCGDGVVDTGEACDDGNRISGDGCSSSCTEEMGRSEVEPNNTIASAQAVEPGELITGGLTEGDVDCFSFDVIDDGWVRATTAAGDGCSGDTFMRLYDTNGRILANDDNGAGEGCSLLEPEGDLGLRYLAGGQYVICIEGFLGVAVDTYGFQFDSEGASCDESRFEVDPSEDQDGDGIANACDDDDDGDGVSDELDNCPSNPNANTVFTADVAPQGDIRDWLVAAWHEADWVAPQAGSCLPSDSSPFGEPASLELTAGDVQGVTSVFARKTQGDILNLLEGTALQTPRAALVVAYLDNAMQRPATLRLGSDDGVLVWLNGEKIFESGTCRGVRRDNDMVDVTLLQGVNTLVMKIHDQGGGWGAAARFTQPNGQPITDLTLLRNPGGLPDVGQRDVDGDGIGDVCDPVYNPDMTP